MQKYTINIVENMLRNYTLLSRVSDPEYLTYKMDLDAGLNTLRHQSVNLYNTVLGVFVYGDPIQKQAEKDKVSNRQVIRRLNDAIHLLTMNMNGDMLYDEG